MRNKVHAWAVTGALFTATALRAVLTFAAYPDRATFALIQWSLVALWLVLPLVAVHRQLRGADDRAARVAAVRLVVAAYAPLMLSMGLIQRLL